ncbi:MAG TPA: ergothioneine biosynthesis protein EgtB [Longimicrobium sp.]|nr:ergothioneine biosynthesis protein EgtB [Longimicrobium sp.]
MKGSEVQGVVATLLAEPSSPQGAPSLEEQYQRVRDTTVRLCAPLTPEDHVLQSMPDASPAKWHLAHTSWFFETFVLARLPGYRVFHPRYGYLFNSYYNAVGERHERPRRGLLSRPPLEEVHAYRRHVDGWMREWLGSGAGEAPEARAVAELGLHHEQQHQELLLTDVKHAFGSQPLRPAYRQFPPPAAQPAPALRWLTVPEGLRWIGHGGPGFAFDNEGPRHRAFVEGFQLASRPVTCAEYLAFIADGGYLRPELWLSEGWDTCRAQGWQAPLYWESRDGAWWTYTLGGEREVHPAEPVCHVSFYEADAYARWAGARLPTEQEWEVVAAQAPVEGNLLESERFHPAPAPAAGSGAAQLFGDVWEWTRSPYAPYPRYQPAQGALGEYNGKFMCNQQVLRGGSCATPRSHLRASYRNFFPPSARWQFTGIRLARDPS